MDRRRFVSGIGVVGISGLAGCSSDDPEPEQEPVDQPDPEPDPEYTVDIDAPERVDTSETDTLDVTPTVRRTLNPAYAEDTDVEREVTLDSDQFTVEVYQARNHLADRYPIDFFRDHDIFYQEFDSPAIDSSELIPGRIELGVTVTLTDDEYGVDSETEHAHELHVEAPQAQLREKLLRDNDELWAYLRKSDDEISWKNRRLTDGNGWKQAADEVKQNDDVQERIDEGRIEDAYQWAAGRWTRHAAGIIGGGGTSGQADFLARTMEHVFDNIHAFRMRESEHDTVLLYDENQDKLYLVDSVGVGDTEHPPKDHSAVAEYDTPLTNREEGDDKRRSETEITLRGSSKLSRQIPSSFSSGDELDFRNMFTDAEFRNSNVMEMREGVGLEDMFDFHRDWGLSAELSPSFDFTATGDVRETPEIVIT